MRDSGLGKRQLSRRSCSRRSRRLLADRTLAAGFGMTGDVDASGP